MAQTFIDDQCILIYGSKLSRSGRKDLKNYLSSRLNLPISDIVLTQRGKAILVDAKNSHELVTDICSHCEGIPGTNPIQPGTGPIHDPSFILLSFILRNEFLDINNVPTESFKVHFGS